MWEGEPTTPWTNSFEEEPTVPRLPGRCWTGEAHATAEPSALFTFCNMQRAPLPRSRAPVFSTTKIRGPGSWIGWLVGALLGTIIGSGLGFLVLSLLHPPPKTVDFESWPTAGAIAAPPILDVPTLLAHTRVRPRRTPSAAPSGDEAAASSRQHQHQGPGCHGDQDQRHRVHRRVAHHGHVGVHLGGDHAEPGRGGHAATDRPQDLE